MFGLTTRGQVHCSSEGFCSQRAHEMLGPGQKVGLATAPAPAVWNALIGRGLPLQAAVATSLYGQRPTLPAETPPRLSALIGNCWHATPAERPTFDQVQVALDELRDSLSEAERLWLDEPHGHPVYEGAGVVL